MRCTPTIHDLIVLTLPPRHRCPLDRMPASRLLLPRSGLERSDFVLWHETDMPTVRDYVCLWGKTGSELRAVEAPQAIFDRFNEMERLLPERDSEYSHPRDEGHCTGVAVDARDFIGLVLDQRRCWLK